MCLWLIEGHLIFKMLFFKIEWIHEILIFFSFSLSLPLTNQNLGTIRKAKPTQRRSGNQNNRDVSPEQIGPTQATGNSAHISFNLSSIFIWFLSNYAYQICIWVNPIFTWILCGSKDQTWWIVGSTRLTPKQTSSLFNHYYWSLLPTNISILISKI